MLVWISLLYLLATVNVQAGEVRRFTAAPKHSNLRRRGLNLEPTRDSHTLLFEEDGLNSAACARLTPKYPTLILDDVSDHINNVSCTSSTIAIRFHAGETMYKALRSWSTSSELVFISSDLSCASPGEHQAYLVDGSSFQNSSTTLTFVAKKRTLQEVTHNIAVDLGHHVVADVEPKIKRRQPGTTTSIASGVLSDYQTASLSPTVSFNFQAPTATPTGSKTTKDINFSRVNKTILPPDQMIIDMFPGSEPLPFVNFGCKECTMSGKVSLEAAGFEIDSNQAEQIIDFFDNGYFQFTADRLRAHMAFEVALKNGFTGASFTANLVKIPLTPIAIPGIITFGPVLELTIPMTVTLNSPVNFTTGFEVVVPDDSKIIMNVSEITGSSQTGFDRSTIKALPFDMTANGLSFNITAALRPKLTISASLGNSNLGLGINGGVGAFLDLPKVVAQIDPVQNVNRTCDGPAPNGVANHGVSVVSTATLDVGLHWELGFAVGKVGQNRDGEQVLAARSFPLPNQCLIFDQKT